MSSTTTQIVRENPEIEAYRLALLGDVQGFLKDQLARETSGLPGYQVAGLTPAETTASQIAQMGVGSYLPYLKGGAQNIQAAQNVLAGTALPAIQGAGQYMGQAANLAAATRGIPSQYQQAAYQGLAGTGAAYDPSQVTSFLNPFEQAAIDQTMADINRQGLLQQQAANAQAVGQGAFGGSRAAIQQAEIGRNVLEQQARTAAQMRMAGFQQASQQAQQAFEQAQARRLQGSQLTGQLGLGYGQLAQGDVGQLAAIGQGIGGLGTAAGNLGMQVAQTGLQQTQLGQALQAGETADIARLMNVGAVGRSQQQAALDAARLTALQEAQFPYQQYSYMSDILSKTPSSQQSMGATTAQPVSPFQQLVGTGIAGLTAAAGAQKLGLF